MNSTPRVVRNDWSSVPVPEPGDWRPRRTVSVVIPAYDCQASLDLTLAALAHQTYPSSLLEVVVVDDGSRPPLELPKLRPDNCRLLRADGGPGRASALHTGVRHSDGDILHWLDADMIPFPPHVEAQARWHHRVPYAVTLGGKRFVDAPPSAWPTPYDVDDACVVGRPQRLFAGWPTEPHAYVERMIARTDGLRDADHLAFLAHVGATAAVRRELYEAAGGLDASLRLGEDTEFGYRLAQAGAVFIPEPAAEAWHLGRSHMMRRQVALQRYNRPFLAQRMPLPRWLRRGGAGAVPLVTVVMEVAGQPLERVRAAVAAVLDGTERDVRVLLVAPWETLGAPPRRVLADPHLELRLVRAGLAADPRVELVSAAPATVFPSPYLVRAPVDRPLAGDAVRRLVRYADRHRLGLVRVDGGVELWRTAAVSRAHLVRGAGEPFAEVVAQVYGAGVMPPDELAGGGWPSDPVEVAGVRSLARAAWFVARTALGRVTGSGKM
jgi:glycosyltransferase involved in cell wall biosynthesis